MKLRNKFKLRKMFLLSGTLLAGLPLAISCGALKNEEDKEKKEVGSGTESEQQVSKIIVLTNEDKFREMLIKYYQKNIEKIKTGRLETNKILLQGYNRDKRADLNNGLPFYGLDGMTQKEENIIFVLKEGTDSTNIEFIKEDDELAVTKDEQNKKWIINVKYKKDNKDVKESLEVSFGNEIEKIAEIDAKYNTENSSGDTNATPDTPGTTPENPNTTPETPGTGQEQDDKVLTLDSEEKFRNIIVEFYKKNIEKIKSKKINEILLQGYQGTNVPDSDKSFKFYGLKGMSNDPKNVIFVLKDGVNGTNIQFFGKNEQTHKSIVTKDDQNKKWVVVVKFKKDNEVLSETFEILFGNEIEQIKKIENPDNSTTPENNPEESQNQNGNSTTTNPEIDKWNALSQEDKDKVDLTKDQTPGKHQETLIEEENTGEINNAVEEAPAEPKNQVDNSTKTSNPEIDKLNALSQEDKDKVDLTKEQTSKEHEGTLIEEESTEEKTETTEGKEKTNVKTTSDNKSDEETPTVSENTNDGSGAPKSDSKQGIDSDSVSGENNGTQPTTEKNDGSNTPGNERVDKPQEINDTKTVAELEAEKYFNFDAENFKKVYKVSKKQMQFYYANNPKFWGIKGGGIKEENIILKLIKENENVKWSPKYNKNNRYTAIVKKDDKLSFEVIIIVDGQEKTFTFEVDKPTE
ncbi:hypothetical protein [Mycoplasma sp. OR1901]|uniref:hypothetical protein n=1 Tax=Mycoplasma sp. OR1901 TaxID=2742195 RepID=UPI001581CD5D|nr:hypothetical protein [Mycoplasma sp. OR1901]QKT05585.1 hypothetical protein HTZ87_02630 [Mycoplasma sp. OR1901]